MFVKAKSSPEVVDNVEQVIASLPITANVIVADVEVAVDAASVTVGAVVSAVSIVTELATLFTNGPVFDAALVIPFAANEMITVPSAEQTTETIKVEPEFAFGANVQLVAVPVLLKSPDVRPVTVSLKESV